MDDMDLSIIVVNYNSGRLLERLIGSITKHTANLEYEIIVVDNGSADDSCRCAERAGGNISVIRNGSNLGFARANNIGLRAAKGRAVLLLNPDVWFESSVPEKMRDCLISDDSTGILGCAIVFPDGNVQTSAYSYTSLGKRALQIVINPFRAVLARVFRNIKSVRPLNSKIVRTAFANYSDETSLQDVDCVTGACLAFRKDLLDKIGYLDEEFFMYYEDEDLCRRASLAGFKVKYAPFIKVTHAFGWGQNRSNPEVYRTKYRSLKYYCRKYYGTRPIYHLLFNMLNYFSFSAGLALMRIRAIYVR